MATIGKLNYIISANTTAFVRAMVASRTEATLQKKILEQMRAPLDDWNEAQQRVLKMQADKKLTDEQAAFALQKLAAQHPEAIAAANAKADADRQAAEQARHVSNAVDQVTRRMQEQLATLGQSNEQIDLYRLKTHGASQSQLEAVAALQRQLQAEQQLAAAREQGRALTESLATAEERRAQRLTEAKQLLDQAAISQETYDRAQRQISSERWVEMGTSIRNVGLTTAAVAGGITAGMTMIGKGMLDAYAGAQDAQAGLQAAMRANGTLTAATLASYKAFGAQMQDLTKVDDDAAAGLLQVAESYGISGDAAERAARNAIAMEAALGVDRDAAIKMTAALEQGNTTLLSRYLPALRSIKDPADKAAAAQAALAKMFGVAEAEAQTYAGASAQLGNAVGDLQESFGEVLAQGLTPLMQGARDLVAGFNELDDSTKSVITYTGLAVTGMAGLATVAGGAIAVTGQLVTWYGTLTATATGARIAQISLNTAIGAGYVAAGAAAFAAGYGITTMLLGQTQAAKDAARAYEEYAAGATALQSREAQQRKDKLASIEAAPAAERDTLLASELEMAQRNLEGLTTRTEMARQEAERLKPSWLSLGQAGKAMWEAQTAEYEALKARAAEAGQYVNQLEEAMRSKGPDTAAAATAVDKLTISLQQQLQTIGQTEQAVQLWQLSQEGATAEQLRAVQALQQQTAAAQANASLRDDTNDLVDSLRQQAAEMGRSESEVQRMRLAARGLSPEWLRLIETLQTEVTAGQQLAEANQKLEQMQAALQEQIATAGMTADEIERWRLAQAGVTSEQLAGVAALQQQAAAAQAAQDRQAKLAADQKTLAEALTETSKRYKEQAETAGMSADQIELYRLKSLGATPAQLAQVAALQQQAKGLQDVSRETRTAKADTGGWTAATRGSSEALDRIDAYRRMLAADSAPKTPKPQTTPAIATGPVAPVPPQTITPAPIAAGIQPTWAQAPAPPAVPPIAAGIQPTWAQTPAAPVVPPIAAGIQPTWAQTPAAPVVPPIAAGIQPTWTPPPPAPVLPPVSAQIQTAWTDILGQPPIPPGPRSLVGPPIVNEGPPRRSAREAAAAPPAGESPNVLLAKAVELLQRIATASEDDKITVEQTA